jgi:putative membrane protein
MSPPVKLFLQRWLINTVAVLVAANVLPGIHYENAAGLLVASLALGVMNALLRPLLLLLSLPLVVFTLGLFTLVINALLLMFVGQLVRPFHVENFWAAFWGGLIISLVSLVLNTFTGTGEKRIMLRTHDSRPPPRDKGPGSGSGPVIDV